jgi:hypothetical protein
MIGPSPGKVLGVIAISANLNHAVDHAVSGVVA